MKKKVVSALMTALLSGACAGNVSDFESGTFALGVGCYDAGAPFVADLIAGGGGNAGEIAGQLQVWNDADNIYVTYLTNDDWCLNEVHLDIQTDASAVPQKNGNPQPGRFAYKADGLDCISAYTFTVANTFSGYDSLAIAAHSAVRTAEPIGTTVNISQFEQGLPELVTLSVKSASDSYFSTTIESTLVGSPLDPGPYAGWCIDTDHNISTNATYTAEVYSSYEAAGLDLVEQPENFDLVNWLINQDYVGQASTCGGSYTKGDVQRAIWTLIEDNLSTAGLGAWSQCRVDEIVSDAYASGEGFSPTACGDAIAVILRPIDENATTEAQVTIAQITLIEIVPDCQNIYDSETAWSEGPDFPGKNWAMYSEYVCADAAEPALEAPQATSSEKKGKKNKR